MEGKSTESHVTSCKCSLFLRTKQQQQQQQQPITATAVLFCIEGHRFISITLLYATLVK